jgi:hypothetical protein
MSSPVVMLNVGQAAMAALSFLHCSKRGDHLSK